MSLPIVTVRSAGSPKYAAGSAALCARPRTAPCASAPARAPVRRSGPRERKYDACVEVPSALEQLARRPGQRPGQVRVGEAEADRQVLDAVVGVAEVVDGEAARPAGTCGTFSALDRDDDDRARAGRGCARRWPAAPAAWCPCPGAGRPRCPGPGAARARRTSSTNSRSEPSFARRLACTIAAAAPPGGHHGEHDGGDEQRQPAAVQRPWTGSPRGTSARRRRTPPRRAPASRPASATAPGRRAAAAACRRRARRSPRRRTPWPAAAEDRKASISDEHADEQHAR